MECDKTKIAIIGRGVSQPKWNPIYEVLDENADDVSYVKLDMADAKWFKTVEEGSFNAYIYLATVPKYTNLPYIKLTANATEDDIMAGMEELVQMLFAEEEITNEAIKEIEPKASSELLELISSPDIFDVDDDMDSDLDIHPDDSVSRLVGIQIEFNGKQVVLNKEDTYKLTELMALAKEFGYQVTDIIVE